MHGQSVRWATAYQTVGSDPTVVPPFYLGQPVPAVAVYGREALKGQDLDQVIHRELGPDALDASAADYRARLAGSRRSVKSALMDQEVLAGLGNLTVDETLWRARIHPARTTAELSEHEMSRIARRAHTVLRESAKVAR